MKRVKVERYVAGKKPAYAKDDDEEDEFTTDDEADDEEIDEETNSEQDNEDDQEQSNDSSPKRKIQSVRVETTSEIDSECNADIKCESQMPDDCLDDEDEDPRFRRLKQLESKPATNRLLAAHKDTIATRIISKVEPTNVIVEDDEDEHETRQRHAAARARQLEEPIGPQAILGDLVEQQLELRDSEYAERTRRIQTEDILKDFELSFDEPKTNKIDTNAEERMKEMLEQAKQEATFKAQIHKKIEEDNKRELEKEALAKGGFSALDMESVKTDDEDEELAYEEWKLREIKRVLRDRSERTLDAKARA